MSEKINHWCILCGKGYHACDSCNEIKTYSPWRTLTDTIEHFKIFIVLKDFHNKIISKEEAKAKLSEYDLSEKDSFKDSAKNVLNEIFCEESMSDIVEIKTSTDDSETIEIANHPDNIKKKSKRRKYTPVEQNNCE